MKTMTLLILVLLNCSFTFAQRDTLVNYNITTQQSLDYPLADINSALDLERTEWSYGIDSSLAILSVDAPDTIYDGSSFTSLEPVQEFYSTSDYPIRTVVKLFRMINDTLVDQCSGILVASQFVLTDCHCVLLKYPDNGQWVIEYYDSLWVFPGFDNGLPNPSTNASLATEIIHFKSYLGSDPRHDIALLKLANPIGENTGWVGIGFNNDDTFFEESIFYEFGYPGGAGLDHNLYNGDTLFYHYGTLNTFQDPWVGYNGESISGLSGSSLLYTDNESYYSYGTLVWTGGTHLRIDPEIFYSFEAILNSNPSATWDAVELVSEYYLSDAYPNPFNPSTTFEYTIPVDAQVSIKLFNLLGREVATLINESKVAGAYEQDLNLEHYESGIYIYTIHSGTFSDSKKIMLLN